MPGTHKAQVNEPGSDSVSVPVHDDLSRREVSHHKPERMQFFESFRHLSGHLQGGVCLQPFRTLEEEVK